MTTHLSGTGHLTKYEGEATQLVLVTGCYVAQLAQIAVDLVSLNTEVQHGLGIICQIQIAIGRFGGKIIDFLQHRRCLFLTAYEGSESDTGLFCLCAKGRDGSHTGTDERIGVHQELHARYGHQGAFEVGERKGFPKASPCNSRLSGYFVQLL